MKFFALLVAIFSFGLSAMALKDAVCGLPHSVRHGEKRPTCRAAIPLWSYKADTNECVQFEYSGCGGNDNQFIKQVDCENKCKE